MDNNSIWVFQLDKVLKLQSLGYMLLLTKDADEGVVLYVALPDSEPLFSVVLINLIVPLVITILQFIYCWFI